ncbi:MAG: ATP-binding protein [Candidatus Riflebacteria bacterium]|nr:ATP-binding protein [Candidatus Riflebacteria bacterium]
MAFLGRQQELAFLEGKWLEKASQFIVLWGKRRVGKTELIKQFCWEKPHVYFLADSTNEKEQLRRFSYALARFYKEPLLETRGFSDWEESFSFIRRKKKKFVMAIDEFPYLIVSNPAIPSLFQKAWDEYFHDGQIFLILLGSSISMMENEVLGYRSPLYGRRTGQWKLEPLPFNTAGLFRQKKSFADRLAHFAVAGGIPAYWLQFENEKDFYHNLFHVLKKGEMLYDEVEFILRAELREPRYYFALLQSIALGKRKLGEIVNSCGLTLATANKYLGILADLGIVEREIPVTEKMPLKTKKGLYRITEPFIAFWFKYVFPFRSELEMGLVKDVIERIRKEESLFLSSYYEVVAREILRGYSLDFSQMSLIGRWWSRNEEIDLCGINSDKNELLLGEVKWTEKPVGTDIINDLKNKAVNIEWGNKNTSTHYCLFSKSAFTPDLMRLASKEKVILFHGENRVL